MKAPKFVFFALILIAFSATSFGQVAAVSDVAESSATIVSSMTILKQTDLRFGLVALTAAGPGDITIATGGAVSTDANVLAVGGSTSAASFDISGTPNANYSITMPGTIQLTGGGDPMDVDLTSSPATGSNTLPADGTETILVGGTLTINDGQAPGLYQNTTDLEVEVNYE